MFKTRSQASLMKFPGRVCLALLTMFIFEIGAATGDVRSAQIAKLQQAVAQAKSLRQQRLDADIKAGLVSRHRFSDTANFSKSTALSGAAN
jgi:hypothetical protein